MNFYLVSSTADVSLFDDWLSLSLSRGVPIALDTETRGLDWNQPQFLRLVQFGTADEGYAVPWEWWPRLIAHALRQIISAQVDVVFHNATFDLHALASAGLPLPSPDQIHDTMVLHHLSAPHERHGLKPVTTQLYGQDASAGDYILKEYMRKSGYDWSTIPVDCPFYWGYAAVDTILTARLYEHLRPTQEQYREAYEREMSYLDIMFRAECRGLRIDTAYSEALHAEWQTDIHNAALALKRDFDIHNPSSNRQVEKALRSLDWSPEEFTETGQARLDKPVLAAIQAAGGPAAEAVELLVDYKRKTKWCSTYLMPFMYSKGRVHPSVRTLGARTGRSSITNPPLQTLPHTPHIRRAVLPEEGHKLYTIDYGGQEYRILASFSQDPAWLDEFNKGKGDPHQLVADELGITRTQAKTFNFAMIYGAGAKKLAASTGLTVNAVQEFLKIYGNRFPKVQEFKTNTETQGFRSYKETGEASAQTVGGRRVVCDPDQMYALTNYRIQGSGADVLKEATVRLDKAGLADYILVPVHDELVLSLPENEPCLAHEIADIMTNREWFDIDITAEPEGPFDNWGEKYDD